MAEEATRIIVTVDDAHLASIQAVAANLRDAGMEVGNVLATTGMITGQVASGKMAVLKEISGVVDVEEDSGMEAI